MVYRIPRLAETELAEQIIAYLTDLGWEVFQEVTHRNGYRADIVAKQGPLVWIVETKVTFGLAAIESASHWFRSCHMVSVGTVWTRSMNGFGKEVCKRFGVGILTVSPWKLEREERVREELKPEYRRRIERESMPKLHQEHKTYAKAGSNGAYFSPFQRTVRLTQDALRNRPDGLTMKELINMVDHHYASDSSGRQHLYEWIKAGKVTGVTIVEGTRPVRVALEKPKEVSL